jgi:tetratricopeptide (TPR) repeat protein
MLPRSPSRYLQAVCVALALVAVSGCGGAQARKARHAEKGQTYLAAGNFEKARVEFRNVLQIDPKDPEALYQMGAIAERLGNPRQAAQFYQASIDANHDHLGARIRLARLYLFSGAPDRTLELIKPALEKHPDDARLLTLRAAVRNQQKDMSGALADAERAVVLAPTDEDAVALLAGLYNLRGDKTEAQTLLEQTIRKVPGSVDLRLVLAQFYAQNNHPAEAEALLAKLVEMKPREKAHRLRLALFYVQSNQMDAAERCLRQAVKDLPAERSVQFALVDFLAAHRGRDQAERELKGMIAAAPDDNELKFALAKFYAAGNDLEQAKTLYQSVIDRQKLEPAGLAARDQLALLRLQSGDARGARALVDEVLAKSPRDEDALVLRGNIELANRDPRAAIADLRAVLRDQPTAVGVLRSLARAQLANGEPESAEETLRAAADGNPQNQALRLDLARLLDQLGKPAQAQAIVLELAKQAPDNLDVLDLEFRVSSKIQDYIAAKQAADAIVALQPKRAVGYFYQGMLAENHDHLDEALRDYRAAHAAQPDDIEPFEAEIRLLVNQKRVADALKRLDEIAASEPKNAPAFNIKGDVLLGSGHPIDAQEAYQQAISRAPKWWLPYRGLAHAQLAAKQDPALALATLRNALPVVDQKDALGEDLALRLEAMGKHEEAIAEYDEILRGYPQAEFAASNLAVLLATYRTDRASLDRAKELAGRFAESGNASLMDAYGWVLYKRGESEASVRVLSRVVEKIPDQVFARYHLGMAEALAGKNSEARDNLARAVNSGQQFPGLDQARAALDKLAKLPAAAAAAPKT